MKIKNWKLKISEQKGQSLVEIMIGLGIGALLIGSAVLAITFTLRSSSSTQTLRLASEFNQDLLDRVRAFGKSNWQNIYSLDKGESENYFLNPSGSNLIAIKGEEGKLENDIGGGLAGHWKFDEAENPPIVTTYDASGNNNTGTLTNGVTKSSSNCKISNCLNLDGINDYVSVLNSPSIDVTQNLTLSVWVKLNTYVSGGTNTDRANIVQKTSQYYMTVDSMNGTFDVWLRNLTPVHTSSTSVVPLNQWANIAITYDGSNIKWYLNGVLDKTLATSGAIGSFSSNLVIGGEPGYGRFANGYIDDVRVYNRALSPEEIKRLHNSLIFKRFFFAENICRSNDAANNITGVLPCTPGSLEDSSTQKITVKSQWITKAQVATEIGLVDYITRWQNRIFHQTDWSGGSGVEGPLLEPGSSYSSSTNIDTTGTLGSIRIKGL